MGKHKTKHCEHPGCTYHGRSDNVNAHMRDRHNLKVITRKPIHKALSERLKSRGPKSAKSRTSQPTIKPVSSKSSPPPNMT